MPFFADAVYRSRRAAVQDGLEAQGVAGLVVGTGAEFEYLTGSAVRSHERLTALVLGSVTARVVAPLTDVTSLEADAALDGVEVVGWRDGEDPYALVAEVLGQGIVEVTAGVTADHLFALGEHLPEIALAAPNVFAVKDDAEVAELAAAAAAIDRVHARVPKLLQPGRTEAEVAAELTRLIEFEHARADFVIVGSGPNGANPHHSYSDRLLGPGDPVVVDIGGTTASGYHSDCTRTYVVAGTAPEREFARAYEVLRDAQEAAVAAARPGMTAGELDAVARDAIAAAGYGECFTHRLGHGIGLAIHEAPFIIAGSDVALEAGMVFSIEPGIYVPGAWGMRIEDIVHLTAAGAVRLNRCERSWQ